MKANLSTTKGEQRRGAVLIAVVVLLGVIVMLCGVWVRQTLREQRELKFRHAQLQAIRLTEAALERGRARRLADESYSGETWEILANELPGSAPASVTIQLEPVEDSANIKISATAEYAPTKLTQIRHTDTLDYPAPLAEN